MGQANLISFDNVFSLFLSGYLITVGALKHNRLNLLSRIGRLGQLVCCVIVPDYWDYGAVGISVQKTIRV
jgi:hypothetical protein